MRSYLEIKQFIEENLGRTDLDADLLRACFGLSRTPLYALFEIDGGVATYVRNRRLARAMRILAGVDGETRRRVSAVSSDETARLRERVEIGCDWGYAITRPDGYPPRAIRRAWIWLGRRRCAC